MKISFWKAICKYGHVGHRNEISVARYIQVQGETTSLEVLKLVEEMPGIKNHGVLSVEKIDESTYKLGKAQEKENLYLQKLMTYNPVIDNEETEEEKLTCA
ncbi:hypothetical protein [Dethiothermospora halolimnae]|uniref:hypothetical protein n=1 Tax=Dethiothermospora halolimnae TaxID=3114390 RepID=UPI003CCBBDF8